MLKVVSTSALVMFLSFAVTSGEASDQQNGRSQFLTGVNIAGAEFGEKKMPGKHGTDYFYPSRANMDLFIGKGLRTLRIPFRWERMQHALYGDVDAGEAKLLDDVVNYATGKGARVILDVHNYASFMRRPIGTADVPTDALADLWKRLAARYKNNGKVIFGLMNEPKGLATETWLDAANKSIAAIRSAGARNLILVPGNGWTGAHSWASRSYGTPNAEAMARVVDPANNFAYEVHQYLDSNYSGTKPECRSATIGVEKLTAMTQWLRAHKRRALLGEFGAGKDATCLAALDGMLTYMAENADAWMGWTYWAAGPWQPTYFTNLQPVNGVDPPQLQVLLRHVAPAAATQRRSVN
ncbi:MAG: glycoside hydrolase family 5 protein [Rhizobiales bacterium]|nr:glycoside hydrolase family 5 protein [Hyphomicrobiales bacterium]